MDSLIYAGNHGLEIAGPNFRFLEPIAVKKRKALGWLTPVLRKELAAIAGTIVEDKELTVSVHYRQVSPRRRNRSFAMCKRRWP